MAHCHECLLPAQVPDSHVVDGVCARCRSHRPGKSDQGARLEREADLERALEDCRGKGPYDAVVCLSGGKDSLYLLHKAVKKRGLRVLAFTVAIDLPEVAWQNIRRSVEKLEVDHIVQRPPDSFCRKLFRHLLMHQEQRGAVYTLSYVYGPLFEGMALRLATERGIPLVLAGYSPGQPDEGRMVYEFPPDFVREVDWTPPGLRAHEDFSNEELDTFWRPQDYPAGQRFPRYLAPFHAWEYDQDAIMKEVKALGLVRSAHHASPIVSNYPINWLMMYSDLKHFGYNPYSPEFADLIREGKASRSYWKVMTPMVNWMIRHKVGLGRNVQHSLNWLGMNEAQLCIDQPRGAYDPPMPTEAMPKPPIDERRSVGAIAALEQGSFGPIHQPR